MSRAVSENTKRAWELRKDRLYGKVKEMSLGCFKAGELRALLGLMGLSPNSFPANAYDIVLLEKAVVRNEELLRSFPSAKK